MASRTTPHDAAQGLVALAGITLGVIPLVQALLTGRLGWLLSWVPGTEQPPGAYLVPAAVVVGVLEQQKHTT